MRIKNLLAYSHAQYNQPLSTPQQECLYHLKWRGIPSCAHHLLGYGVIPTMFSNSLTGKHRQYRGLVHEDGATAVAPLALQHQQGSRFGVSVF